MSVSEETLEPGTRRPGNYQLALAFEDGVTRFVSCRDTQTIADAAYFQGINIPLDCTDGVCGTCKAFCESGSVEIGSHLQDALADDEEAEGYLLPCVTKPLSDLVLQIACTSEVAKTKAATYTGTVVELRRLSATVMAFEVEIPNRAELTFLPGQYVNIAVPGTDLSRSYSFSNAQRQDRLTFLVKLAPGGAMSSYLADRAKVGDELSITGPHGSFFLRETEHPMLLLAGGTGLAPVLAMLDTLRNDGNSRKAHLIYGVNTDEDLVELERIGQAAAELPSLSWDYCVVDPGSTAPNKGPDKAYVTSLISPEHLHDGQVAVYTCGPPPMVDAVRKHFVDVDIQPLAFYYEKFALAAPAAVAEAPVHAAPAHRAPAEAIVASRPVAPHQTLAFAPDARSVGGQVMLPEAPLPSWTGPVAASDQGDVMRRIGGQLMAATGVGAGAASPLDDNDQIVLSTDGREVGGQQMFASQLSQIEPAVSPPPAVVASDGYQIGEDHPGIYASDALFTARQALELGALDLTLGRLTSQQLTGYRLLAEATVPWLDSDRFVDAAMWTETNAAFHDYLFTLTGNTHLLQAYRALGVRGRMEEVLSNASWCHPRSAQDHLDIVAAFQAGDREAARELIIAHSDRAIETMRRAITDQLAVQRPQFVTPGRFAGKVVLVTGVAQGIGERTARRISQEGGTLVLADRSELVTQQLADELAATGSQTLAVTADLEDAEAADAAVRQALTRFGRIDVLVNNFGDAINFKPFTEFTNAEIRAEIDRSLMTTLYACRAVLPSMVARGQGVIVNVSSAATRGIHRIPYSAANGGVNAITASLALEFAHAGIRVVAVAPGGTEAPPRRISRGTQEPATDSERAWLQTHIDQTLDSSLMKRYGTLDEQTSAICFLASDEASSITGTVLPVIGGDQG